MNSWWSEFHKSVSGGYGDEGALEAAMLFSFSLPCVWERKRAGLDMDSGYSKLQSHLQQTEK